MTTEDASMFISSFPTVGDAFFWLGASTLKEIDERVQCLRASAVGGSSDATRIGDGVSDMRISPGTECRTVEGHYFPACTRFKLPSGCPIFPKLKHSRPVMFFDTETTSISPPIVCQLAFVVFESGVPVFQYDNVLTLPANTTVAPQAFKVHGISTRDCSTKGVCAEQALEVFAAIAKGTLSQGGRVVAHNSQFDCRAIQTTRNAWRIIETPENPELTRDEFFCTMKESKKYSNLLDKRGNRKAFRNSELYQHFNDRREPTWARLHSAIDDVLVTAHNYISGEHAGWW